jgi:phosphoribosyl 1,2-cyclic phosphodiesterase
MSFKVCVLGSGSSGNCTVVWTEKDALLIDCGRLSYRYIIEQLYAIGLPANRITGMVITHAHTDHIGRSAVRLAQAYRVPIYLHENIYKDVVSGGNDCGLDALDKKLVRFHEAEKFEVGALSVHPFKTHHGLGSVTMSLGFCVSHKGAKISYVTDCGKIDDMIVQAMSGSHVAVIEANHDIEMVKKSKRHWAAKQRVLSDQGHLSNEAAAELIKSIGAKSPLHHVLLAHVSEEHNVLEELVNVIAGHIKNETVKLHVTYHHAPSEIIEII